jgi:hypothetical protein
METRDIVLALLIVAVGLGIFYLLDPTLGGLLRKREEGFQTSETNAMMNGYAENTNVLSPDSANAPGVGNVSNIPGSKQMEALSENVYANVNSMGEASDNETMNNPVSGNESESSVEGFETLSPAPMPFKDAEKPANCYPKDQINPSELLPNDPNSKWAQVNPMGQGDIAGKNYLSAGALIGVNTVGQSLRNANYQLRSDPPNPQVKVSIWNQSTIEPDVNRRSLEIG